jgi:hypothetical protein
VAATGNFKEKLKLSRLHYPAEILYNIYWLRILQPKWYSQTGEDQLISKYLPEGKGSYVDIGAGLPIRGSNTYFLYKRGWRGIVVDPISINIKLSKLFRPLDLRLQICVGIKKGEVEFFGFIPYGYSTIDASVAAMLGESKIAKLRSRSRMSVSPASDFMPDMNPLDPTLLSIDIEGADYDALCSINWERTKPRVICVEEWSGPSTFSEIRKLLVGHGYELKEKSDLSSIYVHETWNGRVCS